MAWGRVWDPRRLDDRARRVSQFVAFAACTASQAAFRRPTGYVSTTSALPTVRIGTESRRARQLLFPFVAHDAHQTGSNFMSANFDHRFLSADLSTVSQGDAPLDSLDRQALTTVIGGYIISGGDGGSGTTSLLPFPTGGFNGSCSL